MPAFWFSLKRPLQCISETSDVHDPRGSCISNSSNLNNIQTRTRKPCKSGCSRSISNLRDVIHGNKRHIMKPPSSSPRSFESSDFLNALSHEAVLSDSICELKIAGFGGTSNGKVGSTFGGTLRPGTTYTGVHDMMSHYSTRRSQGLSRKTSGDSPLYGCGNGIYSKPRVYLDSPFIGSLNLICKKCGEKFKNLNAVEAYHLSKHAVTELLEGYSSKRIVEIIFRTSWLKSVNNCVIIERVLKVHTMQMTLAQFEEHREMVKIKASILHTKHPRCLADGNEHLRFNGTTVACSLDLNGSSSICTLHKCCICQIFRHGLAKREMRLVSVFSLLPLAEKPWSPLNIMKTTNS